MQILLQIFHQDPHARTRSILHDSERHTWIEVRSRVQSTKRSTGSGNRPDPHFPHRRRPDVRGHEAPRAVPIGCVDVLEFVEIAKAVGMDPAGLPTRVVRG